MPRRALTLAGAPAWLTPDVMLGHWLQLHLEFHGVAHCDLHLGNIMAGSDGTLFVIDFGCSARRGADGNWDIVVRSEDRSTAARSRRLAAAAELIPSTQASWLRLFLPSVPILVPPRTVFDCALA